MTPLRYVSVPHSVTVLPWPEASQADLEALVGSENVNAVPGGVQVRNSEGEWFTLGSGWSAGMSGSDCCVYTPGALAGHYRLADADS